MGMGPVSAGREKGLIGLYRSTNGGQMLLIQCKEVFDFLCQSRRAIILRRKRKKPKRGLGIEIRELKKKGRESSMVSSGRILSAGEELTNVN